MKKLLFITILSLVSCNTISIDNDVSLEESEHVVTLEQAKLSVRNLLHKAQTRVSRNTGNEIKNAFSIQGNSGSIIMHVINFDGGGYIIVSGDDRLEPLLAFSDNGEFDEDFSLYPLGLQLWIEEYSDIINYLNENNYPNIPALEKYWNRLTDNVTRMITPPEISCDPFVLENNVVDPLLSTSWLTHNGYNNGLNYWDEDVLEIVHPSATTESVAIAQIMRYWEFPNNYDWSSMLPNSPTAETQGLIADISDRMDGIRYYQFEGWCSTWRLNANKANIFRSFGYSSAVQQNYNSQIVTDEIMNNRPVIMAGKHRNDDAYTCWICDGVRDWEECLEDGEDNSIIRYTFFHVNYSINANYNAWYSSSHFVLDPDRFNPYSRDLQMVVRIYP